MTLNSFLSRARQAGPGARSTTRNDARHRLELLDSFETANLGWFWATDRNDAITYLSPCATQELGADGDALIGQPLDTLFDLTTDAEEDAQRSLRFLLRARNSIIRQTVRIHGQADVVWWEISAKPRFLSDGTFDGYRGSAKDVTLEREERREAARVARFDTLTGLANRRCIADQLDRMLSNTRINRGSCALFMLDLDRFKHVNDTLGHPAGDALLKQVAIRMKQIIGDRGEIGRLGGDEFQVILPDCDDRGELGDLAQRCIQVVSQPYLIDGNRAVIGASVGIAIAPYDGDESDELVAASDLALYASKGAGRGQFRFYSAELRNGANLRREVEESLRDALVNEELVMHYQPIVDLRTNKVRCFEALMRWDRPGRGPVSPAVFIPVAEDTGLIRDLGRKGLEQACRDAAEWPGDIRVAVNVSAVQFAHDDLPQIVARTLEQSGLAPERLELEITESVFMGDVSVAEDMLHRLKKLGVRLALDDFGTGYSSLSYLSNAPYDKIKIDQSFVRGATEPGSNNRAILKAIVDLARSLDMDTVAEGVEAQDELELVRSSGATHGQGYIFAKALPQDDVMSRLAEGRLEYEAVGPACFRAERMTVIRRIGVIHEDYRYQAFMRNLSRTGARIEGLLNVPVGTEVVVDLGDGQLAVAVVRRSSNTDFGVEFETPLVNDGAGGLCTRHRVSPYALQVATRSVAAFTTGAGTSDGGQGVRIPRFQEVALHHGR